MLKKLLSILLMLVLLAAPLCAPAEETGPAPAYMKAWICGTPYGYGTTVSVLVATDGFARKEMTPEQAAEEIRFCPFDEASGLYVPGDGEPAGDRAEIVSLSDGRNRYTVRLKEPGRYLLSGAAYYLLDPGIPAQAALRAELDGAVTANLRKGEKETAKALHGWLAARVSPLFPEADAARLSAACGDPMNALLTGYACREAYAALNSLLLNAADIRCLTVSGTAGEAAATWSLCRLDGAWRWTDAALDDVNDKKGAKYFALDDAAAGKDHVLCAADEAFAAAMIRPTAFEALAGGMVDRGQFGYYADPSDNLDLLVIDGPAYVIGESATVTFRFLGTVPGSERLEGKTLMEYLTWRINCNFWDREGLFYQFGSMTPKQHEYEQIHPVEYPDMAKLITLVDAAEDLSSFTVTFNRPGRYDIYFGRTRTVFYLIGPDEAEPVALAAEMDKVVEKAKAAKTEKAGAKVIYDWVRSRLKYNYAAYDWERHPEYTVRDMETNSDAIGALLYGKAVCAGYTDSIDLLMRQAGMITARQDGMVSQYDMMGHAWNAVRLDGEWYETDATWGRFAWTAERMAKDHQGELDGMLARYDGDSAFGVLSDLAKKAGGSLSVLPLSLKYLPASAEAYGFPATVPAFMTPEVTLEKRAVTVKLPKPALVRIYRPVGDVMRRDNKYYFFCWDPVKQFTAKLQMDQPIRVEIITGNSFWPVSKNAQWIVLDYDKGELVNASYRQTYPEKTGRYPGFDGAFRYVGYDADMNPASAGWFLQREKPAGTPRRTAEIQVFFDAEGRAQRYAAEYTEDLNDRVYFAWEGAGDGTVTALKGKPVKNPAKADPGLWEPVWFE